MARLLMFSKLSEVPGPACLSGLHDDPMTGMTELIRPSLVQTLLMEAPQLMKLPMDIFLNVFQCLKELFTGPDSIFVLTLHDCSVQPPTYQVVGIYHKKSLAQIAMRRILDAAHSRGLQVFGDVDHAVDASFGEGLPVQLDGEMFHGVSASIQKMATQSPPPPWRPYVDDAARRFADFWHRCPTAEESFEDF